MSYNNIIRKGLIDNFNAFMVKDAKFEGKFDIPLCPTTAENAPQRIVPYDLIQSSNDFDAFVHFYIDDQKFDGKRGIWNEPEKALEKLKKFAGVITPDFSTNQDFPVALKIYNTYRMRAFGYWLTTKGINVINNVRAGTYEEFDYMLDGVPENSIISIGTIGCIKRKEDKERVKKGLDKIVNKLFPKTILVYGNAPDYIFKKYIDAGIEIINYPSQTSAAFKNLEVKKNV